MSISDLIGEATTYDKKLSLERKEPLSWLKRRHAKVIVRAIRADASITILEMRRKTKLSQSGVYKILTALKNANIIRRVGPDKGGHWEVIANTDETQGE